MTPKKGAKNAKPATKVQQQKAVGGAAAGSKAKLTDKNNKSSRNVTPSK